MLYFPKWLVSLIIVVCAIGVLMALPNALPEQSLSAVPNWLPHQQLNLGLDLRGGSYLLLEVDMNAVVKERLENVVDSMRSELRAAHIGYTGLQATSDEVRLTLTDPKVTDQVRAMARKVDAEIDTNIDAKGNVSIKFNPTALEARRRSAVEQSIEIVRRRIDESGTKEPTIQREGTDRILVQLPGVGNPEHVKELLGRTAKMTFQLVDENVSAEDAARGRVPPGDVVLPMENDRGGRGPAGSIVVKRRIMVSGDTLTDAQPTFENGNEPVVSFKFDSTGARRFGEATRDNVGKRFAIVLDNKVISAPVIREAILGGQGIISGSFTVQSASDLALLLRAGALPAPLTILEQRTVGPDLGADSIREGTTASVVAVVLVVVFMFLFYGLFGIFADIALFFNLCLMFATLTLLGATLTLPGIAGIALTLGMAVDANVLIYERIREEVRGGRSLISSLQAGFERAFGTILDSHVTTLVAGALMFWLGSGPVKGFAVTLSIGVLTSLFSAILVTRLQVVTWLRRTKPKEIPI
ncbi:MAG TPA: protein translocase subunit SecD [Stellaceae bacterium]|jgi:protein-export membrane protein SecD|nr:protein translocase subunit SecD [Stellaceae bacterium]